MRKILLITLGFILIAKLGLTDPSVTMTLQYDPSPNDTISSSSYKSEENHQITQYNSHTHTDITSLGTVTTGTWQGTAVGKSYGGTGATSASLVGFTADDDGANGTCLIVDNDGTGDSLYVTADGVLASGKSGLEVYSGAAQTNTNGLVRIDQSSASSSQTSLVAINSGTGLAVDMYNSTNNNCVQINKQGTGTGIALRFVNSGTGEYIKTAEGNENLSNAGVWTDRTSFFADKENLQPLITTTYIDKLKDMNMYSYQKKAEVYGNKVEVEEADETGKKIKIKKYPKNKRNPNARTHIGYVLDDLTTPEELISRNSQGEIDGMSGTQNANFLLAVNKELINKIEKLEARIVKLENP